MATQKQSNFQINKMEVKPMVSQNESKKKAPPRYTASQRKAVVDAAKTGMSLSELIEKFPMGKRAIQRYLRKADINLKN